MIGRVAARCAGVSSGLERLPRNATYIFAVLSALAVAGCGGGAPAAPALTEPFNDWPTYAFDARRDGFNPNSSALSPASLSALHLAWESDLDNRDYRTQTQPVIAANVAGRQAVVFAGGGAGAIFAFDAVSGAQLWSRSLGEQHLVCPNAPASTGPQYTEGIAGTPAYDPSGKVLYALDNQDSGSGSSGAQVVYRLDPATGAASGEVNVTPSPLPGEVNSSHAALTLGPGGRLYAATSSTCADRAAWRGRVAEVDTTSLSLRGTFFTTTTASGTIYSGGGVWGWGGVSLDDGGNVYAGVGNTDTSPQQGTWPQALSETSVYGDHVVALAPDLSAVLASDYPGFAFGPAAFDLDFSGTPVLFRPVGCDELFAAEGKSGQLFVYDTSSVAGGPLQSFAVAPAAPSFGGAAFSAYSPLTGLLYASIGTQGLALPGLVAIKPSGCAAFNVLWSAAFGPDSLAYTGDPEPRSAPTVTAGGVVFVGTPCTPNAAVNACASPGQAPSGGAVWAVDAASGAVLAGGAPILVTRGVVRMAPVVDGKWLWVTDDSGALYAMTIDPAVAAVTDRLRARRVPAPAPWRE